MNVDYFKTNIKSEFVVLTNTHKASVVTKQLGIEPSRSFSLGDRILQGKSLNYDTEQSGLWAFTKSEISTDLMINNHIKYLLDIFLNKKNELNMLRREYDVEVVVQIWVVTEDAGFGFDLNSEELRLLSELTDRFTCFINTVDKL